MGLISRVSSRTYRECRDIKMTSKQVLNISRRSFFFNAWKKPMPTREVNASNITEIQLKNKNNPQGPFHDPSDIGVYNKEFVPVVGAGTKDDPFIIPARNPYRYMWENADLYGDFKPFRYWWLYAEGDGLTPNGMQRSPYTGRFFKMAYDPTDYYGVDKVDMHSHGVSQY